MSDPNPRAFAELLARLEGWEPELTGTLVFVVDGDRVLLIEKKTGHGAGKINAPGGKLDPGESAQACAVREVREEVGIEVLAPEHRAELRFVDTHGPQWLGHAFIAREFSGEPVETREAKPFWCPLSEIPFDRMWEDDRIWLPMILGARKPRTLRGDFLFTRGKLLAHRCDWEA